jgi:hypothetical protein
VDELNLFRDEVSRFLPPSRDAVRQIVVCRL